MNKKQLRESIMAGVRRSFKENKSLNESFSDWKEVNVPKFDMEKFQEILDKFATILINLAADEQVSTLKFQYYVDSTNVWETLVSGVSESGPSTKESFIANVQTALQKLKDRVKTADKFAIAMRKTSFNIATGPDTYFHKYIESTLDPANGKIKDNDAIVIKITKNDYYQLYITTKSLMENFEAIVNYLS